MQPESGFRSRDSGALYVHFQSENGPEHRTIVLSPKRVRALRALWSWRGITLVLALSGSWVYFGMQTARVPRLQTRVAELEAEARRMDTLEARLAELQQQYDQVHRMLGAPAGDTGKRETSARTP